MPKHAHWFFWTAILGARVVGEGVFVLERRPLHSSKLSHVFLFKTEQTRRDFMETHPRDAFTCDGKEYFGGKEVPTGYVILGGKIVKDNRDISTLFAKPPENALANLADRENR